MTGSRNLRDEKVNLLGRLRDEDELYKLAIEVSESAIWYWDLQTNTMQYSEHWKEILGAADYTAADMDMARKELVHPDDQEQLYSSMQKYLNGEIPCYENKFRLRCKDGSYKWIFTKAKVIEWSEDGKPLKVIGIHTDITHFKYMQQIAHESTERVKNIFEHSPIAIGIVDAQGKMIDANRAFLAMFGVVSFEDIEGKNAFLCPNFPQEKTDALMHGKTARFDLNYSFDLAKKSGLYNPTKSGFIVIDCLITPLLDEKGQINGFMGHIQDITKRTAAEKALRYSERKLRTLLDTLDAQIFTTDKHGRITEVYGQWFKKNQINKRLFLGSTARQILGEQKPGFHDEIEKKILSGENAEFNWDIVFKGKKAYYQTSLTPILNDNDEVEEVIGIGMDITKPMEAEIKYRNLVEGTLVGVYLYQSRKVVYANRYFEQIFGFDDGEAIGKNIIDLIYEEDIPLVIDAFKKLNTNSKEIIEEFRIVKKDGSIAYVQSQVITTFYNGLPAAVGTVLDITEQKKAKDQINHMAFYDSLTDLPNRYLLNNNLRECLERFNSNKQVGIMFIDLDRFKVINDTLGHNYGDMVLKEASLRLRKCVRKNDIVSRYGGDEFIILLEDVSKEVITGIGKRIISEFSRPFCINNRELFTSPSIGISLYPTDSEDMDTLIRYADTAMYLAKSQGKNTFRFYTQELNRTVSRGMELENGLRKAVENNEFLLYYQPQVELDTGRIIGVEALIRWQHPELGMIAPMEFIPLAEETGLIVPIGRWVLETACHQMSAWIKEGLPPMKLAVNVSGRQINQEDFVEMVGCVLQKSGLSPQLLEVEITESAIKDIRVMSSVLEGLKALGVKSAIDDFGTGYSTLSILQHLNVDTLKIEHSFVSDIVTNPKTSLIVETIIRMAHVLNLDVIAENIEDEKQLSVLKQYKCEFGQGYLFSRPLPPGDILPQLISGSADKDIV